MAIRPVLVVAGVGNATGTGAATARLFAKAGYRVALIARNADRLKKAAEEINNSGRRGLHPCHLQIKSYRWPSQQKAEIRVALYNVGAGVWGKFLDISEEDIQSVVDANITAAFAFARQIILAFKENEVDELGRRGTLLFTGATAGLRGNVTTSAFSAGKFALRALSQSLNKEFGKENIHVAHAIIDGVILTDLSLTRAAGQGLSDFQQNADIRLNPESIAKSYMYLANQDRSAWTWELDLRPAHEKW
ncbi:putative oxidoreductase YoxD [Grifola frondosa]|uniref:Putative oxidoreductase YoxD n=1 Tax=Grifola frondosa TaxID=5627 RepID=A0A1C7M7Q5_GRIFR|nr:putative oxidoreductase YoxD [Grifola frondosa]